MKFGCCIDLSYYDFLAELGYEAITLPAVSVAAWSDEEFQQAVEKIRSGPLQCTTLNSFCPPSLRLTGTDADPAQIEAYTALLCRRSAALGIRYIGIGAPKSRSIQPGSSYQQALEDFKQSLAILCRVAAPYGIDILLESVCGVECNLLTTTKEALAVVREMNLPNLHLVYDTYHEFTEGQALSIIAEAAGEIRTVHIAENVNDQRFYLREESRALYRSYLSALQQAGYQGECNLECLCGDPKEELPASHAILSSIWNELR